MSFNVKSSTYDIHMKTKILADFQICISVPLRIPPRYAAPGDLWMEIVKNVVINIRLVSEAVARS